MAAAQENINQTIIKDLDVVKPDLNLVLEFSFKANKIHKMKINLIPQKQKLKKVKGILLPRFDE